MLNQVQVQCLFHSLVHLRQQPERIMPLRGMKLQDAFNYLRIRFDVLP